MNCLGLICPWEAQWSQWWLEQMQMLAVQGQAVSNQANMVREIH